MLVQALTIGANVTAPKDAWIAALLGLAIAIAASVQLRRLRGTTLTAPALWAIASLAAIGAVEAWLAWRGSAAEPLTASLLRFTAAVSTFCPVIAVLGAKRPQDGAWQWVVLTLWIILLVPAAQAVAVKSGDQLELFGAWRILIGGLIAMGLLNYLPTKHAAAAILLTVGQALLVAPFFGAADSLAWRRVAMMGVLGSAALVLESSRRRWRFASDDSDPTPVDRLNERWFALRDGWGAFWALRIMQRVNQSADLGHWPMRLSWWDGLQPSANPEPPLNEPTIAQMEQTFDSLLWRFERRSDA
jgi:hypothetical protein